jgi:P-type Ca2+ transporter type 2C
LPDLERFTSPIEPVHVVVPGRARFHVRGLYHSPALKHAIERELALRNQINRVSANPLTGNVLVAFDKRLDSRRIAELLQDAIRRWKQFLAIGRPSANPNSRPLRSGSDAPDASSARRNAGPAPVIAGDLRKSAEDAWHCREAQAVADRLGSSRKGLSELVAAERLRSCGPKSTA